jgi:hypothetical protein
MIHQIWRLSEGGEGNLGLACTSEGLALGRTPLIERRNGRFVVRKQAEIERLLRKAYRAEVVADRLMPGLTTVAAALNANDQALARIAAVHLRLPDLPDAVARDGMEVEDRLIKYSRDEGSGSSDWNPALHPRTGAPPNPGWFATTGGSVAESFSVRTAENNASTRRADASPGVPNDDWVRLSPGPKRIDELADFIEWIANAKPEDEKIIRAEIDRYFKSVGDEGAANNLNRKLTIILRPGITRAQRQEILKAIDLYSYNDPTEVVGNSSFIATLATGVAGVPPIAAESRAAQTAATEAATTAEGRAAAQAAGIAAGAEGRSEVWKYGWAKRGRMIEHEFSDESLHPNFPVIDSFSSSGIATSIKSIDLTAAVYQNDRSLAYRVDSYFDKVSEFDGAEFANDVVRLDKINGRVLRLVVPKGSMTDAQRIIIEAAAARAKKLGRSVDLILTPY